MATNRIKSASVAVYANDTQLDRLQAFGVSARLDSEDLKEIGNLDIVEVIDSIPTVDITCDANQYGSIKTLAKFANKNRDWATVVVTLSTSGAVSISDGDVYLSERLVKKAAASTQAITFPTGALQHKIDALSITSAGAVTYTQGTATGTAFAATPATAPAGQVLVAYVESYSTAASAAVELTYLNILNVNGSQEIKLRDFEFAKVDFVVPVKESGDNTETTSAITRSMYISDAFVNRYDAAFSVNGLATENYSLESDNKTWFLNSAGTIFVDRLVGAGATSAALTNVPTVRDNNLSTLAAYKYNASTAVYTELTEQIAAVTSAVPAGYSVSGSTITFGTAPTTGEVIVVRYPTTGVVGSAQPFFRRVPNAIDAHPVVAGGLKQGQVEIYLSDDATNHVLRLQSVSISSSLAREALYEIGHKRAYDRPMTFPIPITIQVEATASDLKEFARLCGKSAAYTNGTLKELSIDQFIKNLDLTVKIYREDDVTRASAPSVQSIPLKTIQVDNVTVTDENTDVRVEGNGTQTFGLKANTSLTVTGLI